MVTESEVKECWTRWLSAKAVALRRRENEGYVRDGAGVRWIYIRNTAI